MAKNEDGEFELVVGNRQLLSIVFVMMVLFGVVFSLGYFVGRNSAPEGAKQTAEAGPARGGVSQPTAEPPAQAQTPAAAAESTESPLEPGEAKVTAPTTTPVGGTPAPSPGTPPVAPVSAGRPEPPATMKLAETPKPAAASDLPGAGQTFLQVAAVKRPEAELIVDVLKKKGFPAMVAPVVAGQPDDALWRALVGPLKDTSSLAQTRSALQAAGFSPIVRKY